MQHITAQQSRDARRELGLSQTEVAKALDFNRQYLSEFETSFSTRLTNSQLNKLRSFYEEKITEAKAEGEVISIKFGAEVLPASNLPEPVNHAQVATVPYRFMPVYLEADQPTVIKTQNAIQDNDARIAVLLQQTATHESKLFGSEELSEDTQNNLHEVYSLMAANYALWRSLSGWPALGLSASNDGMQTIRDVVFHSFADEFAKVGLINQQVTEPADQEESEEA